MTTTKKAPGTEARRYATRYPTTPNCDRCDTLITGTDSNAIRVELYTSNPRRTRSLFLCEHCADRFAR